MPVDNVKRLPMVEVVTNTSATLPEIAEIVGDLVKEAMGIIDTEAELTAEDWKLTTYNTRYSPQQKWTAVAVFVLTGNLRKASEASGVPYPTVRQWRTRHEWWAEAEIKIKASRQVELDALITHAIHNAVTQLLDRVVNGEEVTTSGGKIVHKKLSADTLARVAGIMYDKRAMLRGERVGTRSEDADAKLDKIIERMTDVAEDITRRKDEKVISSTYTKDVETRLQ